MMGFHGFFFYSLSLNMLKTLLFIVNIIEHLSLRYLIYLHHKLAGLNLRENFERNCPYYESRIEAHFKVGVA